MKLNNNAEYVHNNKTHRSTDDAFRDANYASWFESDHEMSDMKLFISEMLFLVVPMLTLVGIVMYFSLKLVGVF